jgi:diguanylate cyclase (GGDEF)-like protein
MLDRLRSPWASGPLLFLGAALGYAALGQFIVWLNDPSSWGAGYWPAAGFTLGVLVLVHPGRWGWVLAGVGVAELGSDLARGYPLQASLWWTAANCLEPLVGVILLRRWGNPAGELIPVRQLLRFFAAAVFVGPLVGATIGSVGSMIASADAQWWAIWPKYLVGDALGVLVVAPVLLCWRARPIVRHWAESASLALVLLVVPFKVFIPWTGVWEAAIPYLVIPLLTWAALRFGIRGAAVAVFAVTQIATWSTVRGHGHFAVAGAPTGQAIALLQVFLVIVGMTTFVLAAMAEDLVDRKEVEQRLEAQATTDALTGLPNRAKMMAALDGHLVAPSSADGVGVLVCDVDHFKVVNDGLGHHAGDEVLIEMARRMRGCVHPDDVVARFGGDEFVIIVAGSVELLETVARRLVATIATPMTLSDGTMLTPSASVGLAHGTPGSAPAVLLRNADAALFRAKELGRGRFHRYDEDLRLQLMDRLLIQTELVTALTNDDLSCVYQPEIVIASGEVFCFEALSRWDHPTRGQIAPDRFIPVVEAMGAADQLFKHVLAQALGAQSRWAQRLGFHPAVAVNMSARQLGTAAITAAVAGAIDHACVPADSVWIEVTESAVADDSAARSLRELHELGVHIAIDDFGTGWSSMARLAAFPWDLLKIEQSFVQELGGANRHIDQFVKSTIAMAHALGIPTTAEGVETPQQLERLGELGCDNAQGFLFAPPRPPDAAIAPVNALGRWTGPGLLDRSARRPLPRQAVPAGADGDRRLLSRYPASPDVTTG